VKLDAILEALELANDSISSYLDVDTGDWEPRNGQRGFSSLAT
jgi:hypothetical protein